MNLDKNIYKKLLLKEKSKTDVDSVHEDITAFYMGGAEFFQIQNIKLAKSWFPKDQQTLDELVKRIVEKRDKTLKMFGLFNKVKNV